MHNLLAKIQKPFSHKKVLKDYKYHFLPQQTKMFAIFYHIFTTINHTIAIGRYCSSDTNGIKTDTLLVLRVSRQRVSVWFSHWLIKGSLASDRFGKMTGPIVGNTVGGISEGNLTVPP